MELLVTSAITLAKASKGSPVVSTATVGLFYLFFNIFEALIEKLIWGERFEHFLDPVFCLAFMAYAAYVTYVCSHVNSVYRFNDDA